MTKNDILNQKKDEQYIIELYNKILNCKASTQHKFDFLVGDPNKNGKYRKLPVDAYYEKFQLVIEYHEKQHTENVKHFDKPDKLTISGVHRGEQRKIYDERRKEVLPKYGIDILIVSYSDFQYNQQKKIIRDFDNDILILKEKLRLVQQNIEANKYP